MFETSLITLNLSGIWVNTMAPMLIICLVIDQLVKMFHHQLHSHIKITHSNIFDKLQG